MEIIVSEGALNGLTNYAELVAYAKEQVEPYVGLVVTEDELSTAKDVVARMRKTAKAASDLRIRTEKEHAAKIALTVSQLKEITSTFTDAATKIDEQVKTIVNARKAEKRGRLVERFNAEIGAGAKYIAFEDVEDPKWMNTTVTPEAAEEQLLELVKARREEAEALDALVIDPGIKAAVQNEYKRTKSFAQALMLQSRLEREAQAERERREARKAAEEAAKAALAPAVTSPIEDVPEQTLEAIRAQQTQEVQDAQEELITHTFWVTGTREQFRALREFLTRAGMKYGRPTT